MKTRLADIGITLSDYYEYLKDADYKAYCKVRAWTFKQFEKTDNPMTKEYFAVYWKRITDRLHKEYGFKKPVSPEPRAEQGRNYRAKRKQKDEARLRRIREAEVYKKINDMHNTEILANVTPLEESNIPLP